MSDRLDRAVVLLFSLLVLIAIGATSAVALESQPDITQESTSSPQMPDILEDDTYIEPEPTAVAPPVMAPMMRTQPLPASDGKVELTDEGLKGVATRLRVPVYDSPDAEAQQVDTLTPGYPLDVKKTTSEEWLFIEKNDEKDYTEKQLGGYIRSADLTVDEYSGRTDRHTPHGIILDGKQLKVFRSPDADPAGTLFTYEEGISLKVRQYNEDWYVGAWSDIEVAGVRIADTYGFISAKDVKDQQTFRVLDTSVPDAKKEVQYIVDKKDFALLATPTEGGKSFLDLRQGNVYRFTPFDDQFLMAYFIDSSTGDPRIGFMPYSAGAKRTDLSNRFDKLRFTGNGAVYASPGTGAVLSTNPAKSYIKATKVTDSHYVTTMTVNGERRNVYIPTSSVRVVPDLYVYVDVGHGLNNRVLPTENRQVFDPGALGLGYQEHALNLELSRKIVAHLEAMDIQYFLNDDGGYYGHRDDEAVELGANRMISIHFNSATSGTPRGYQVYVNRTPTAESLRFQDLVAAQMNKHSTPQSTKDKWRGNFAVLMSDKKSMPSVLLEVAFIINRADMDNYMAKKDAIARDVAQAIRDSAH